MRGRSRSSYRSMARKGRSRRGRRSRRSSRGYLVARGGIRL